MLNLRARRRALGLLAVVLMLLGLSLAHASGINPKHDFGCAKCHSTHQPRGRRLWPQAVPEKTKSGVELFGSDALCYTCHQDETAAHMFEPGFSHPSGIPVKRARVSPNLPVQRVKGIGDVITCTSCHDPHSKAAKMLRIPTANDQLCLACHKFD